MPKGKSGASKSKAPKRGFLGRAGQKIKKAVKSVGRVFRKR